MQYIERERVRERDTIKHLQKWKNTSANKQPFVNVYVYTCFIYDFFLFLFTQKKILLYFSPSWGEINLHATDVSPLLSARTLSPDLTAWVSWWNTCIKGSPPPVRLYSPGYSCMATINFHLQSLCSHILPGGKWQQVQKKKNIYKRLHHFCACCRFHVWF